MKKFLEILGAIVFSVILIMVVFLGMLVASEKEYEIKQERVNVYKNEWRANHDK